MKKVVGGAALMILFLAACSGGGNNAATPKTVPLSKLPHTEFIRGELSLGDLGIRVPAAVANGTAGTSSMTTPPPVPGPGIGAESIRGNLSDCAGAGAFADLVTGAPVIVSDDAGKPVGAGKINYGIGTNVYQGAINQCTFRFIVEGLPYLPYYNIKIASQKPQRVSLQEIQYTRGFIQLKASR